MKHEWNESTWRCRACGAATFSVDAALPCRPDDGAAFVVALADPVAPPSDTEPFDVG